MRATLPGNHSARVMRARVSPEGADLKFGSAVRPGLHHQGSTERTDALPNADQAQAQFAPRQEHLGRIEADAVVSDATPDYFAFAGQQNVCACGPGVSADISEHLLDGPVQD